MSYGNLFHELRDNAFDSVLDDYAVWDRTGVIPDGGVLAKIRDNYCGQFDVHGLMVMERHLLNECVIRLQRQYKQQKGV